MLTETERQQYIEKIEALPQRVEDVIRGLSAKQMDIPYREGGWTPRQIIHHLADSHIGGYSRMKLVLTEDMPLLKSYEQEQWAKLSDVTMSLESSLLILRGLHARWVVFLRSIPSNAWSRKGNHTEDGEMTLDDLLADYANHGEVHLSKIHA